MLLRGEQIMTEFEINKKVASIYLPCDYNINEHTEKVELIRFLGDTDEYEIYGTFDPCNNVSQAWEIMMKYNISIQFEEGLKPAAFLNMKHVSHDKFIFDKCAIHKKPLVAAMLVFLEI